jgi:hypothetical protein
VRRGKKSEISLWFLGGAGRLANAERFRGSRPALHATPRVRARLVALSALARNVSAAAWPRSPASAARQSATSAASSIVASGTSSRYRSSRRAATRGCRPGSFRAISIVRSSASVRLSGGSSFAVASATTRLPRSTARLKMVGGWPCEVDAPPPPGPTVDHCSGRSAVRDGSERATRRGRAPPTGVRRCEAGRQYPDSTDAARIAGMDEPFALNGAAEEGDDPLVPSRLASMTIPGATRSCLAPNSRMSPKRPPRRRRQNLLTDRAHEASRSG